MRIEEIQEGLADHETRILFLENSLPFTKEGVSSQERGAIIEPEWTRKQWDTVQQLQGQVLHLQSKVEELLKTKKKRDNL